MIADPELVIADEPTGDLDSQTAREIINLMHELNRQMGTTFIVATHNIELVNGTNKIYELIDGSLSQRGNV